MGNRSGCPGGVYKNIRAREWEIEMEWTERATRKNERIVAEGYAKRQIAETLRKVEKIKTEL